MSAVAHGAVVLAAGASRRLGRPKALLQQNGESLLRRATRLALDTRALDTVVVLGAEAAASRELEGLAARAIACPDWDEGLAASLRTGIAALDPRCACALVLLCDQPALDGAHLAALLAAWQAHPGHAAASAYAGVRGVPAILPRAWFGAVARLRGDAGARELLRTRDDVVVVSGPGLARDIDTPADLA